MLGFEPTTFGTWVSSHNHLTRALALGILLSPTCLSLSSPLSIAFQGRAFSIKLYGSVNYGQILTVNFYINNRIICKLWSNSRELQTKSFLNGREPWSSGNGWRLMFKRLWVQIPAPHTGWTFEHLFTFICCKNCTVCLKRPKINKKEAGVVPFT